jgi:uncharacterized membrane protein
VQVEVSVVEPWTLLSSAVIVVVPQPTTVANPAALMVAMLVVLDDQLACEVMSEGGTLE